MNEDSDYFFLQAINRHRMVTDGEGVTTLVALAACPLKCKYCINMDVLSSPKVLKILPEELWEKLSVDYCYYVYTGGGVTFGGGECLLQADAIRRFIRIIPDGVSVNIETSLNVNIKSDKLLSIAADVKELIIDIKSMDKEIYQSYTGFDNEKVMGNLKLIASNGYADKCKIRIPIIPGLKSKADAENDKLLLGQMGFSDVEIFRYIIRDYMKKDNKN